MAEPVNIPISALPLADAPQDADLLPVVQVGVTKRQTISAILARVDARLLPGGTAYRIGYVPPWPNATARTVGAKFEERPTLGDFSAPTDGVTNATPAFSNFEASVSNAEVDLQGFTYLVDAFPSGNRYYNGRFKRASDGVTVQTEHSGVVRVGNSNTLAGRQVAQNLTPYSIYGAGPRGYNLTAYGDKALSQAGDNLWNCSAFGPGSQFSNRYARYNCSFGLETLFYTEGVEGDLLLGTRNTTIGDNSMRFNTTGYSNLAGGRNANQIGTTAKYNVFLGPASGAGRGPLDLRGIITNPFPRTADQQTATGTESLYYSNGSDNSGHGFQVLQNVKRGKQNTGNGSGALKNLEKNVSPYGTEAIIASLSGTWSQTGDQLTFVMVAHGMAVGNMVEVVLNTGATQTGGDAQYFTITAVTTDTWTATAPDSATRAGNCTRIQYFTAVTVTSADLNTATGFCAMENSLRVSNCVANGAYALRENQGNNNTATGMFALSVNNAGTQNTADGYSALRTLLNGSRNTAVGEFSLGSLVNGDDNTGVGLSSLRGMQDGSAAVALTNATGIGANSRVSGSNQVQIGNSATTTYVYGTVQNRSDPRDKTDIRETVLGLEFIKSLVPIDFRWDMREDYIEHVEKEVEVPYTYWETVDTGVLDAYGNKLTRQVERTGYRTETVLEAVVHPRDGSRARERFHHGFDADRIRALIEESGVDFGGYQDHLITGGGDVKSLGYDEFIAPLVRAVQQLSARVEELEAQKA